MDIPLFNIPKVLVAFEKELNNYEPPAFNFIVDRYDYSQDIGSGGQIHFKVEAQYSIESIGLPMDIVNDFYKYLSMFVDKGMRASNYAKFEMTVDYRANGPLHVYATIDLPITYDDFGDQM